MHLNSFPRFSFLFLLIRTCSLVSICKRIKFSLFLRCITRSISDLWLSFPHWSFDAISCLRRCRLPPLIKAPFFHYPMVFAPFFPVFLFFFFGVLVVQVIYTSCFFFHPFQWSRRWGWVFFLYWRSNQRSKPLLVHTPFQISNAISPSFFCARTRPKVVVAVLFETPNCFLSSFTPESH